MEVSLEKDYIPSLTPRK